MPRLFHAPSSPYSAKVRMAALHAGIPLDKVATDTNVEPADLLAANPLGKIPPTRARAFSTAASSRNI